MTEALDADAAGKVKVFLLVTGDADYIKLVTLLRNRFDQRVIIVGVPGSIACASSISGPKVPGRAYRARPTRDGTPSGISGRRNY